MKLLDLFEKFRDQTPELGGYEARPQPYKDFSYGEHHESFDKLIKDAGWTYVNSGLMASVYEHPKYPGQVMKVLYRKDSGYLRFYSMAKRSDNPHYPEVSRLGVIKFPDTRRRTGWDSPNPDITTYAVMLEKLNRYPSFPNQDNDDVDNFTTSFAEIIRGYARFDKPLPEWIDEKWPLLRPALELIKKYATMMKRGSSHRQYGVDIHSGNIMWRGNFPVITDPLIV